MSSSSVAEGTSFTGATSWLRATTLVERVRFLQSSSVTKSEALRDVERGRKRLAEWRSQPGLSWDRMFEKRLTQLGLNENEFADILSLPAEAFLESGSELPAWVGEIERAFAEPCDVEQLPFSEEVRGRPQAAFLGLLRPLLSRYVQRLRERIRSIKAMSDPPAFDPHAVDQLLLSSLPRRVYPILLRTLALEMHVARLRGILAGDTPAERFASYIARFREPEVALELLREYPVLARQVVICLERWLATSIEFLERWSEDWPAIRAAFSRDQDPGPLVDLEADAGDTHRGGRAVLIARCRSGFTVVYKPKSLAVDQHFQDLLDWLNARGFSAPFRQLQMLDRGSYGWQEFVSPESCTSPDEVARFYRRHGGYLALLYALAATDFHHENVIAAGQHPVLIDLEALFHPQEPLPEQPTSDHAVGQAFDESVLAAGLLPLRERVERDSDGFDMSGMGAEPGQKLPWRYPTWEGLGTDEMHLVRQDDVIDSAEHLPALNGTTAKVLDFVDEIETGFREMYELLRTHRAELLAPGGPLERFAADEVRVVLRATNRYGELLDEGYHPDLLRDALDRDRHFDRLWQEVPHRSMLESLIPAEVEDLWRGDIPFFSTRPESRDLWSSTGQRFAQVHSESGMEYARRRFDRLGADDLDRQTWFLRAALATLPDDNDVGARSGYHLIEDGPAVDRERLLATARAVADRLEAKALRGTDDVNWIGLTPANEDRWSLVPLGTDLYDGLPGVILFLAHLGKITAEERYTGLARAAFKTLRRRLAPDKRQKAVSSIGGFSGWGGIIYTLANLGVVWNEPALLSEAEALVAVLPDLIAQDKQLDIISGAAGCIAGLLCLHELKPSRTVLAAAVQCGEHLLSHARSMPQGLGWGPSQSGATPLTGFSHGAAGISWALAKLATQTGEERFRKAAMDGIAYERSLFLAEEGNWPDLRPQDNAAEDADEQPRSCMTAWCHGAPGIGLARLGCLAHLDDPMLHFEIEVALQTTLQTGFGRNHCLCHGDLGNLELLRCAAREYPDSLWSAHVDRLAAGILHSMERDGWRCPSPLGVQSPDLMTGYTGIGYALLCLAEPEHVPSVLTLAPQNFQSSTTTTTALR